MGPSKKKDDRNAKENYRPITLLPCVSKVLEKLVGDRSTLALVIAFTNTHPLIEKLTAAKQH